MNILLKPSKLQGTIDAMPSKSHAHRILIAQKLAQIQGQKKIDSLVIPTFSEDIKATKNCLAQMDKDMPFLDCKESGSTLRFMLPVAMALKKEAVFIGTGKLPYRPLSPLKEEMERHGCRFDMGNKTQCHSDKHKEICTVCGTLQPGEYQLPGNISSQFITGLLFALPLLNGGSVLTLTTGLESAGYVDLTLDVLKRFGIKVNRRKSPEGFELYEIDGNQRYLEPDGIRVEGDWSNAAFWLAGGALGGNVTVRGLNLHSPQRDKEILDVLQNMGAEISITELPDASCETKKASAKGASAEKISESASAKETSVDASAEKATPEETSAGSSETGAAAEKASTGSLKKNATAEEILEKTSAKAATTKETAIEETSEEKTAEPIPSACEQTDCAITVCCGRALKGAEVNAAQTPDMVPILATVMALSSGVSMITNAERLKIKESDRLHTVCDFLSKLGADITDGGAGLSLTGKPHLQGGQVESHNDHRIAMAAAIASCGCENPVLIRGAEAVKKSYPGFFEDFAALGGIIKK